MPTTPVNHKSAGVLADELCAAARLIEVDAQYAHYKNPQSPYTVTGFAIWEATDEIAVLYEVQEDDAQRVLFARPVRVWLEMVEWRGSLVPRFTKVLKNV